MEPLTLAGIAGTLMVGAMVQSSMGFGIALFAVPLLLLQGLELPQAMATLAGAAFVQTSWGAWTYRDRIDTRLTVPIGAGQVVGIPLGALALTVLTGLDPVWIRVAVAGVIFGALGAWAFWDIEPVEALPTPIRFGAGLTSGLLAGMVGMAGPPLVLYGLCHEWDKDRFRVFLWSQMVIGIPLVLAALVLNFGTGVLVYTAIGVCCAPLVWLAFQAAMRVTRSWDGAVLRQAAMILLGAVALYTVISAV